MRVYRRIESVLSDISGVFLFLLGALITFDVIGRFFDLPIRGTHDLNKLLLAFLVWAGVAFVTKNRGHVAIDLFVSRFPPRAQKCLDILATLLGMLTFVLILWSSTRVATTAARLGEVTDILEIPTFPMRFMISLGAVLALVELSFQLAENVMSLVKKKGQVA